MTFVARASTLFTRLGAALVAFALATSCRHSPPVTEASSPTSSPQLARLAEEYWELEMRKNPVWATFLADRRFDDELPDMIGRAC
ncbi:MAG TPA: hypothetical protein VE618_06445 [Myxococcaceae bacterium]|nr:hypothetical protein [Myxococcaceae bacterium]